jgi:hypothetical protein
MTKQKDERDRGVVDRFDRPNDLRPPPAWHAATARDTNGLRAVNVSDRSAHRRYHHLYEDMLN